VDVPWPVARNWRRLVDSAAARGAATVCFCLFAAGVSAQFSGTASVVSDYRYRGITLSDQKPAAQIGLTYDDPLGWYAGAFASTVRLAPPAGPGVQATIFTGFASRLASGISLEAGGDYSAFTSAAGDDYGEAYLGVASEKLSARIYYSPRYYGQRANAWYGEFNAAQPLTDRVQLLAHVGLLTSRTTYPYAPQVEQHIVDGRIGLGADFDLFHLELAWVGIDSRTTDKTASVGYLVTGSKSPNTVVLTLSRQF
jgi:uncharacterized protein (TIGR02001 family)